MTDAPERIWAFWAPELEEENPGCTIAASERPMHGAREYIRADLVPRWQPIETAPKDGTLILACNVDPAAQNPSVIYWEHGSGRFGIAAHWRDSTHHSVGYRDFTHWRHLPEPPQ